MYTLLINDIEIPENDILNISQSERQLKFAGENLISAKITIQLSNIYNAYDDRYETDGLFEDVDWYNWVVELYDDANDKRIWYGRLKKYIIDDSSKTTTIESNDYVQDMADTTCVISASNKTASEIIYQILTDNLLIPEDHIVKGGFEEAKSLQANETLNITYTASDNTKCISVLSDLCSLYSESYLYIHELGIAYWQWREYNGVLGTSIKDADILPGSYTQEITDAIVNEYSVAYNNSGTVAYVTGSNIASQNKYGSGKIFASPKSKPESTAVGNFRIIFTTQAGATALGARILSRYKDLRKQCKFTIGYDFNYLQLGDILDLRFSPFIREPVQIIGIKEDINKRTISITAELVNYPKVVDLDLTPPESIEMLSAYPSSGSVYLKWSKSSEAIAYNLYFTSTEGYWKEEVINGAISPLTINLTSINYFNGDCYYKLTGLNNGTEYYFKIAPYDASFNEADHSNVLSAIPYDDKASLMENAYCTDKNLFWGVILDSSNSNSGYLISGYTHYDDLDYDGGTYEITAVYESPLLKGNTVKLVGSCDNAEDIMVCYRNYDNGSFGSWRTLVSAMGFITLEPELSEFQLRVIFKSPHWSDEDMIYIEAIE